MRNQIKLAVAGLLGLGFIGYHMAVNVKNSIDNVRSLNYGYVLDVHAQNGEVKSYIVDKNGDRHDFKILEDSKTQWILMENHLHITTDNIEKVSLPKLETLISKDKE